MVNRRAALLPGTRVQLEHGNLYEITGEPIGSGGGSLIYPAHRLLERGESLVPDGIVYALKECYPLSQTHGFVRSETGEIVPERPEAEALAYLSRVREMQLAEQRVTQQIYRTGSRLLPIRESAHRVALTPPGGGTVWVENTVTVMESLSAKGQSLESCLRQCRRMTTVQTFHVIRQLLFALREVHEAGFLHLDLQGRNIFLRGDLSDGSDIITIIDFGCARPLTDGRTEPIRDRVIFTTQGFSAPEILRKNDGALRLGPEADLYAVGCLILYLLTGSVYSPEELQSNTTGLYLTRFKLRRIDCPRHLIPRLQAIIAHALKNRPEDRYHSAGEMLEDVSDFCAALQPYRSDLAAVDYDAFLCYRHGPVDSAAARALQRHLEHFRTAPGFAGARRPFDRVFLDEGELSSCADMGEQIRSALKNAGWLIVICSPETPGSPWVQREIETFLEYHDRSRILAVLTGGEPEESFPPQLREGDGHQAVLAADARGKDLRAVLKKLRRDALLRIAAPMLGATYDALRQRRQIYRLQRAAAAATLCLAAAVAFSVYAFRREQTIAAQASQLREQTEQLEQEYENALRQEEIISTQAAELEEEYRNTLLEQSRYLLSDAQDRLAENDVLGALERLVAALPSEEQDRPVLPEAVYALTRALGVYELPGDAEDSMTPAGSFELPEGTRSGLLIDPTGQYLFTSTLDTIYVWDAETGAVLRTLSDAGLGVFSIQLTGEMLMTTETHLIADCSNSVVCWDYVTGEVVWQTATEDYIQAAALSEDESSVVLLEDSCLQRLSTRDGGVLCSLPLEEADMSVPLSEGTFACSGDGSRAAFASKKDAGEGSQVTEVWLADLQRGTCRAVSSLDDRFYLERLQFVQGDLAAVCFSWGVGSIEDEYTIYTSRENRVTLYDGSAGTLLWTSAFSSVSAGDLLSGYTLLSALPYSDGTGTRQALILYHTSSIYVLDRESGALLKNYELDDRIVAVHPSENGFRVFTRDGSSYLAGFSWAGTRHHYRTDCFTGPITDVCWDPGQTFYYTMQRDTRSYYPSRIVKYEYEGSHSAYEALDAVPDSGQTVAVRAGSELRSGRPLLTLGDSLSLYDPNTGTLSSFQFPEVEEIVTIQDSVFTGDGRYLDCILQGQSGLFLRRLELAGETWEDLPLPTPGDLAEQERWTLETAAFWKNEVLLLGRLETERTVDIPETGQRGTYVSSAVYTLLSWDPNTGQLSEIAVFDPGQKEAEYSYTDDRGAYLGSLTLTAPAASWVGSSGFDCHPSSGTVRFWLRGADGYTLVSVDLESGAVTSESCRVQQDGETLHYWKKMTISSTGQYTACIGRYSTGGENWAEIDLFDAGGRLLYTLDCPAEYGNCLLLFSPDDRLLIAGAGRAALLYEAESGSLLATLDLSAEASSLLTDLDDDTCADWLDPSTLLLTEGGQGYLLDFSGVEPGITAVIDQCLGYDPEGDRFLVSQLDYSGSTAAYQFGAFHHYTLPELTALGRSRAGAGEAGPD